MPQFDWSVLARAGRPQQFRRGSMIYLQGQEPTYLYYLQEGTVRSYILSDDGEEKTLATYRGGSLFGEAAFFDGQPRMSSAAARSDCRIILLDRAAVQAAFAGNPALALEMLCYVSGTVRHLSDQLDHMTFLRADQRVARYLLSVPSDGPTLHLTQDDLANAVGLSRVTVCRALKALSEQHLLETRYGSIRLLNRAGLEVL